MATNRYTGDLEAVAQVDTVTLSDTWAIADTITIVFTDVTDGTTETHVYTTASGTKATICTNLATWFNALTSPIAATITALGVSETCKFTADTAGVAFLMAVTCSTAGDGDVSLAHTTANAGANDYLAGNFWNGTAYALPTAGDTVIFEMGDDDCLYNLDQSSVALAEFKVEKTYEGLLGGIVTPLKINAPVIDINYYYGAGNPTMSGRINLETTLTATSAASVINVFGSGTTEDSYKSPVRIACNNSANVINVRKGDVAIAGCYGGQTSVIGTCNVGYISDQNNDAKVNLNPGVTCTTYNQTGGINYVQCPITTITVDGGTLYYSGGNVTTLTVNAGTVYLSSTGTVTTLNIADGATVYVVKGTITTLQNSGVCDFRMANSAIVVTNFSIYKGSRTFLDPAFVTASNGYDLVQCGIEDLTLEAGANSTWTQSSI